MANCNPFIISVAGSSCSGKTFTAKQIAKTVADVFNPNPTDSDIEADITILSQDHYYIGGNNDTNYDEPGAIEWPLIISHLNELRKGNSVEIPVYNFEDHKRTNDTITAHPAKVIIIEGTMIFNCKEILEMSNIKVFVTAYSELMYTRRLKRDVDERKRTTEEVNMRYFRDVVPGNSLYVEATKNYADIILVNNSHDKFVGLQILLDHIKMRLQNN